MEIEKKIKDKLKEQRLYNLQANFFELRMDLAAYEANQDSQGIEQTKKKMESCEKSYKAILDLT